MKRTAGNLYVPGQTAPYKISRSKIELFRECPRCLYLDRRLGVQRPAIPAFSLNSAVDRLLKNEFDLLREAGQSHALMRRYGIDAVPFRHQDLDVWRENFVGIRYRHDPTGFLVFGAVDDIWVNPQGELIVVDYKSTSTDREVTLEGPYKGGYKRQLEVYQWLLKGNGFSVSGTACIVYANAGKNRDRFDGRLEFELTLLTHTGDTSWVEPALHAMKSVLDSPEAPEPSPECAYCTYRRDAASHEVQPAQLRL